MPHVEVSRFVQTQDAAAVYALLKDMERYPAFMPDLISVKVAVRTPGQTVTEWKSSVNGMKFTWTERDFFDDAARRIRYAQIEGDLQTFAGEWRVAEADGGCVVTLTADFSLGIPMLAALAHPLLALKVRDNCLRMLTAIEKELCKSVASEKRDIV